MPSAVLVHGGFHGGWCWKPTATEMRSMGWDVYAPSLTGLGDRAHLLAPEIDLETHVQDIVRLIEEEDLSDVVLCAHSAGGVVAGVVADRIPDRLARLVCLDAAVPQSGESLVDILTDVEGLPAMFRKLASDDGEGWLIPPAVFTARDFGIDQQDLGAWVEARLCAHPLRPFEDPAVFSGKGPAGVRRRTFVRCEGFPITFGTNMIERFEADPGWETERWDVGHDAMLIEPRRVAGLLVG